MRAAAGVVFGFTFVAVLSLAVPAKAQLYGDSAKDATSGDLNDQDYWWTKFDMMMLDVAEKQRAAPGRIGLQLTATSKRLDELTKKYPKHEELKKWKAQVDETMKKIDPGADRSAPFGPTLPWEEANFAQLWVNLHWSKMLVDAKDWDQAKAIMTNVRGNYDIMMKPDRMKDYPEDLRKWVQESRAEIDRLSKILEEKSSSSGSGGPKGPVSDVASGDLNDQDYWWTKYDMMMVDVAIKEHEPEGRIDYMLATASKRIDDLMKKYPKHTEIADWKKKADDIHAKIDPKADRNKNFGPECPWEESNFAQLWVNLHHAQAAHATGDDATARSMLGGAAQNYDIMMAPDRMKNYPEDLRKWVQDSKADIDKLREELKAGGHRGERKPK